MTTPLDGLADTITAAMPPPRHRLDATGARWMWLWLIAQIDTAAEVAARFADLGVHGHPVRLAGAGSAALDARCADVAAQVERPAIPRRTARIASTGRRRPRRGSTGAGDDARLPRPLVSSPLDLVNELLAFAAGMPDAARPLVADARRGLEALTEALSDWRVDDGHTRRAADLARRWDATVEEAYRRESETSTFKHSFRKVRIAPSCEKVSPSRL